MTGIKIPVSADFDGADAEKAVNKLNEQMNKLGRSVAEANKVKFDPVPTGSLDQLKAIEARFKELQRISGGLRDRLKVTGQTGASFGSVDWNRLYDDPTIRARKMQQAYQHVTAGSGYQVALPTSQPGNQPPPANQPAGVGAGIGQAVAGVAGAGLRATGSVGGVVANAASAGMSGGFGAGLIGLAGGLAALAVGKGISAVKEKVDAAGQEGISYDTLKRTLGDVNVSFGLLRESLRSASNNIDVTFEESQKLGGEFAKLSGISKDEYKSLADEVSVGGGFGRSFGVDPSTSNQFFAEQRQFGVTSNVNESRKLAVMIGEAVSKAGAPGKTEELLQAIAGYTSQQARNGLSAPNIAGYSGLLSGLVSSRTPGLDPQGAAALLGRVNGAISNGGGAGEAGQNYLFNVLGKRNGLDPVQATLLQQQGAFGTGRMAFGANADGSPGLYQKFSARFGGGVSRDAASDDKTNLATVLERVQKDYKGNPSLMLNATARLLGVNESQAMALHTVGPNQLGGMTGRMSRMGLDMSKLSSTGISALSNIEGGSDETLRAQAAALSKNTKQPLSGDESKKLNKALDDFKNDGDSEKLKDILTTLTYSREQEQTEGSKTRDSIQGVEKRIQELATGLVGPMNDMRNAMVYLAGGGKKSAAQINKDMAQLEYDETAGPLKARRAELTDMIEKSAIPKDGVIRGGRHAHKLTEPELQGMRDRQAALRAERDQIDERLKAAGDTRDQVMNFGKGTSGHAPVGSSPGTAPIQANPAVLKELEKTDKEVGLSPGTSAAQIKKESGFNPNAFNRRSGAMGMAQVMPKTLAAIEQRVGRKLDPYNQADAILIHREVMRENKARFGTDAGALAAYNSGWDERKWGNSETVDYLGKISKWKNEFTPMPEGAPPQAKQADPTITFKGDFTLNTPAGVRAADSVMIKKSVSLPQAAGVAR